MMDFGWSELLLVFIVAIFAIGPEQMPELMYKAGRLVRRLQYIRFAITRQMEDYLQVGDLHDLRSTAPLSPEITREVPNTQTGPLTPDDEAIADSASDMEALMHEPVQGKSND